MKQITPVTTNFLNVLGWKINFLFTFLYCLYASLVIFSINNGFFWDSILLASQYGQWYYENNFKSLFVPNNIAGYPPLFGMFIALCWKLFGKTLLVSHLAILPFALGIVKQVLNLCQKFFSHDKVPLAALLLLMDPTLIAQCTQVAPDVLLVFLYLYCLNKIFEEKWFQLMIALVFLGMLSPRGTIAVSLIFVTDIFLYFFTKKDEKNTLYLLLLTYIPAGLFIVIWQLLHFKHFGWIGYDSHSNWGAFTKILHFKGMLRNVFIIFWRSFDFGRISIWFVFLFSALFLYKKAIKLSRQAYQILIIFLVPFLGFSTIFLPFSNPIAHRYYIVTYLLFALFVFYLLSKIPHIGLKRSLYGAMLLLLASGHLWVYPDYIAKGWDATLAHLPYFKLRKEAIHYLDDHSIPLEVVGSAFPNLSPMSQTDLKDDNRTFKEKDLAFDKYILYSNVFNDFTDEEMINLKTYWQPLQVWKRGQVHFTLYGRPVKGIK
jgi:hypothetical protein